MTPSDVLRVREARRRLREVAGDQERLDPAIRVIELESPRPDGLALTLHPDFAVVSGLSERAHGEILNTIDALHRNTPTIGLGGTVVVAGELFALHDPALPVPAPHVDLADDVPTLETSWSDEDELLEVVDALERAVMVTAAELRGADAIASELRSATIDVPEIIDLRTTEADRDDIRQTLEALDALAPDSRAIDELVERVNRLNSAPSSVSLQATVEQYSAALARVQPTDAEHVRENLEQALDDAVEAQNAVERERRADLFGIVDVLTALDVSVDQHEAVATAERVIAERSELDAIRARLLDKLSTPAVRTRRLPDAPEVSAVERRTAVLRRKLRSQRHILVAARAMLSASENVESSVGPAITEPIESARRPKGALPFVAVDPLEDLPRHLGAALLSILLRLSRQQQVICLSDDEHVHDWIDDVGRRAGRTIAQGWFAGRPEPC